MLGYTIIKTEKLDNLIHKVVAFSKEMKEFNEDYELLQENFTLKVLEVESLKAKIKRLENDK